jgi:hypothetical protein
MKEYYLKCKNCGSLFPYLTYFLSKEENEKLTEEDKQLCYDCYMERRNKNEDNYEGG